MKNTKFIKAMAILLSAIMLLGVIPMGTFAAGTEFVSETHDLFSSTTSTIAPGVTQSINYAYAKDGKQMVYYVATADITRDDVIVQTSYLDQYVNEKFGMEKLTNQIAYADKLYTDPTSDRFISENYKVVAGVNASFYNMTTGQPSGVTYLDGIRIGESASYNQIFAIKKDGTAYIEYTKNLKDADYDEIWQAAAGSQMLVYGGKDVTATVSGSYNTDRHSRTCVGVTADGKVVFMSLDGRQEPFSCGGTMHELAQIMLEQGCVAAINLDGGGSTTFAARQEGQNNVSIVNRPSDGSERSISSGLIIASLASPSDKFERASLKAESEYVTPGSTVNIAATGVSPAGTAATIPEDVSWKLADSKYGTVEDGVFVSNGTAGAVTIQMTYEDKVVGSTVVNVVVPEALKFNNSSITVPYGKSVVIGLTATYGLNEVTLKDSDIAFTLSEKTIGSFDGLSFTAGEEGIAASTSDVTAAFTFAPEITATATLNLGKGSEVIFDFEDGTTGGLIFSEPEGTQYNYVWPESNQWVVTSENGKVHSGNYAMKAWVNYSNSLESGYMKTSLVGPATEMLFENATRVGMWIYVPEEAVGLWARWTIQGTNWQVDEKTGKTTWSGISGQDMDDTAGGTGVVSSFKESGWHYLSVDTSAYAAVKLHSGAIMQFYISDRDGSAYGYDASDYANIIGNFTFYIDDITIDYSEAVDDRDAPKFSSVVYADEFTNDAPELNGQTTKSNVLSFTATVADVVKSNMTGLNAASAKAYIDGVAVDFTYADGKIAITDAKLADGKHTVKFSICDNMGNYASVIREITVNAGSDMATVKLVPHDATLDRILHGSVYYMDLVATDIDTVKSVVVSIDLDSLSTWQLDHMELAEGFEATYSIDADDNIATIEITCTGAVAAEGEAVLASIPVRIWQLKTGYVYENGTKAGQPAFTSKQFHDMKEFWRIALTANVEYGLLTNQDDTTSTFTGESIFVDTEMWAEDADMIAADESYYNAWNGGHIHTPVAIDDKAATCTETGYTGRTFCEVCNSVVDWGETVPATGHTYSLTDDGFKCVVCDATLGNYTGMVYDDVAGVYRYLQFGAISNGWKMIGDDWYYFNPKTNAAVSGDYKVDLVTFAFEENGKLVSGAWYDTGAGYRYYYGPDYYRAAGQSENTWATIDGKDYCFDKRGYRLEGLSGVMGSNEKDYTWYEFDENGVCQGLYEGNGFAETNLGKRYFVNGKAVRGLVAFEGNYYYFSTNTGAMRTGEYTVNHLNSNGLLTKDATFVFDAITGAAPIPTTTGFVTKDGVTYYYVNGEMQFGLQKIDGYYYYFSTHTGAMRTGEYTVNYLNSNGMLTKDTTFVFDATTGAGSLPTTTGFVTEGGVTYYYVNGEIQTGLQEIDGSYYYFSTHTGAMRTGEYTVNHLNSNGLLTKDTTFVFDATTGAGSLPTTTGFVTKDGVTYYYVNGEIQTGLQEIDGSYYYFSTHTGAMRTGEYTVNHLNSNGLLTKDTTFVFDATTGAAPIN